MEKAIIDSSWSGEVNDYSHFLVTTKSFASKLNICIAAWNLRRLGKTSGIQLVVVVPTRESAASFHRYLKEAQLFGAHSQDPVLCIGGFHGNEDIVKIHAGSKIIVGTPGRINFLVLRGFLVASSNCALILDEVSWLFNSDMKDDVSGIWIRLPKNKQVRPLFYKHERILIDI